MQKIRMNTEFRNKILNRYVEHAEKEITQEQQAFLQARENIDYAYPKTFALAKLVVERAYPSDDVATCKTLKKKYGQPLDVVAKDKCFYKREELKAKECNPDILAQQNGKDDNPHKTKHIDANNKALGYSNYSSYNSDNDNNVGMTREFDSQFYLDIIGTSHCRSRTIACTREEFLVFKMFKQAKSNVITCHQKWIDSIEKQKQAMKTGLKAYRYLSEGVELMKELGVELDEAELVRCNSTGLTIYNPVNLASMIKGMKNTTMTREQKIALRKEYEAKQSVN
jgi:hypothetical protein